jgi:hypothetical protein
LETDAADAALLADGVLAADDDWAAGVVAVVALFSDLMPCRPRRRRCLWDMGNSLGWVETSRHGAGRPGR